MHTRSRPALEALASQLGARASSTAAKPAPNKWARPANLGARPAPMPSDFPGVRSRPPTGSNAPLGPAFPAPPPAGTSKWAAARPQPQPGLTLPSKKAIRAFGLSQQGSTSKNADSGRFERERPAHFARVPQEESRGRNIRDNDGAHQDTRSNADAAGKGKQPAQEKEKEKEKQDDSRRAAFRRLEDKKTSRKRDNLQFKSRGSLAHHGPDAILHDSHRRGTHPETNAHGQEPKKRVFKAKERRVKVDVFIPNVVSVGTLARLLKVPLPRLQRKMREAGMEGEDSYDHILTADYAALLAEEFGRNAVFDDEAAFDIYPPAAPADTSALPQRPPIVTIMGHVDHGKTTLLDTLRSASVAAGEAGGITQHIGAFSVPLKNSTGGPGQTITFLDTPGHAAFSAMRARGASVTDIVVLVVAADDGVMPQTKEVIELVKKDNLQLVVALNKCDKPGADTTRVLNQLLVEGVETEPLGGSVPAVEVSGLTGLGLSDLVETLGAVSEVADYKAERTGPVHGFVLESRVQKGLGNVATVLVLRGRLTPGASLIAGKVSGKSRVMTDSAGKGVKAAFPGDAVTVSGWKELPGAGDEVLEAPEADVKRALANRLRKAEQDAMLADVEAINAARRAEREAREEEERAAESASSEPVKQWEKKAEEDTGVKELRLVVKADVSGSAEALVEALQYIGNEEAKVKIVASDVGEVSESDVLRAKAADGMVIAFNVNVPKAVHGLANSNGVDVHSSAVIYKVIDDVRERVTKLLPVELGKTVSGEANVLRLFDISVGGRRTKRVAGCRVASGQIERAKSVQVVRNGEVVFEGKLDTLKHLKEDVSSAGKNMECGMAIEGFSDLKEGDLIQTFSTFEKPRFL
ncbi:unnamed protein product [Peniophora sp. CBMAI 1063]|nr:unnamed protein product [Peniophora sp. CBMAI 1063]